MILRLLALVVVLALLGAPVYRRLKRWVTRPHTRGR